MKERLLVLDDEPLILNSIENLFEDDFEVLTARDAGAALQLARERDIAVVLSDERMPGLSGHEFLRQVRELSNSTRVLFSGCSDLNELADAVNHGQIFAYVCKPWEPLKLKSTIQSALQHFKLFQASEHERALLRVLMENTPDLIYFKDRDSRYTRVNHEQARTLGARHPEECIGKKDSDYFAFGPARHSYDDEQAIVRSGRPLLDRIEKLQRPDGSLRWLSTIKVPIVDKSGSVSGIAGISRDISKLMHAEESLRDQSENLQLLQAVTVAANESSTTENAARTSLDRICRHTGWPLGHVLFLAHDSETELVSTGIWWIERGKFFGDFRQASDRRRFASGVGLPGRVLASAGPEWTLDIGRDSNFPGAAIAGQAGLRSGFAFPILAQKRVVGVLEFFSLGVAQPDDDLLKLIAHIGAQLGQVFLRQRVEEDRQRSIKLAESANRAKSEFLATMSHEIRTPMNAMLGMADLLWESNLDPEQRDYVRIFQSGGARLLDLINDILDLSKVESGRFDLDVIDFEVSAVLEKAIEIMSVRAQARGLWLTSEILPDVPARLSGDPGRLRQILINLIGNALKFTEQGGVSLRVEPDSLAGETRLRFSVTDTGIGIAADKVDMIFESFAQVDSSITRRYGGTGLGLAISKGLVELMGGKIGCASKVGKGSTFFFTAPFGPAEEKTVKVETPSELRRRSEALTPRIRQEGQQPVRILIAEDSDDNLFLIEAYLKDSGLELDVARDGKEAFEKVTSGAYHLVLMDVDMPVMDGYEATRAIRDWEARALSTPVPIVALTAHALKDELPKSTAAGCTGFLSKPIKKAILLEAIYQYAAGTMQLTS